MRKLLGLLMLVVVLASCSRVEPNYEGILMENYGRGGKSDFHIVSGKQWTIAPGTQLYQVPMFEASILNRIVVNAYREEARNYTTDSLMTNLNKFEAQVQARLKQEFALRFFELKEVTSGLTPPQSMATAIETRNNAIQEANTVENELKVSTMRLAKAKIDAEANKIRTVGLTREVLTKQYIEMLASTKNKVIITDGKTPMIYNNN
jgi:hypothetical protein